LRGRCHRTTNEAEERHIAAFITINYLLHGHAFTDATLRTIAMDAFAEKCANVDRRLPSIGPRFIMGFKTRYHFLSPSAVFAQLPRWMMAGNILINRTKVASPVNHQFV
jgi:hypothetical protein